MSYKNTIYYSIIELYSMAKGCFLIFQIHVNFDHNLLKHKWIFSFKTMDFFFLNIWNDGFLILYLLYLEWYLILNGT